jgi:hypothetical protein
VAYTCFQNTLCVIVDTLLLVDVHLLMTQVTLQECKFISPLSSNANLANLILVYNTSPKSLDSFTSTAFFTFLPIFYYCCSHNIMSKS